MARKYKVHLRRSKHSTPQATICGKIFRPEIKVDWIYYIGLVDCENYQRTKFYKEIMKTLDWVNSAAAWLR